MIWISEAVQEPDRYRLHLLCGERFERAGEAGQVQRHQHFPLRIDPLADWESQSARNQRRRQIDIDVVLLEPVLVADLETSRNPSVVSRAVLAPLRSITAFVASVVPWTTRPTCWGSMPACAVAELIAVSTPSSGALGVVSVFAVKRRSPTSSATSVNVPPISRPSRILDEDITLANSRRVRRRVVRTANDNLRQISSDVQSRAIDWQNSAEVCSSDEMDWAVQLALFQGMDSAGISAEPTHASSACGISTGM